MIKECRCVRVRTTQPPFFCVCRWIGFLFLIALSLQMSAPYASMNSTLTLSPTADSGRNATNHSSTPGPNYLSIFIFSVTCAPPTLAFYLGPSRTYPRVQNRCFAPPLRKNTVVHFCHKTEFTFPHRDGHKGSGSQGPVSPRCHTPTKRTQVPTISR